mmetsp:Transcript_14453/g.21874  ORF Transcript_14453/g.21874 Transcript_14453/m.21874 type:complete len:104 (-) Transcript_14453:410-721(-)
MGTTRCMLSYRCTSICRSYTNSDSIASDGCSHVSSCCTHPIAIGDPYDITSNDWSIAVADDDIAHQISIEGPYDKPFEFTNNINLVTNIINTTIVYTYTISKR